MIWCRKEYGFLTNYTMQGIAIKNNLVNTINRNRNQNLGLLKITTLRGLK